VKKDNITDINAMVEWNKIDKEYRDKIIDNAFCSECFVTTIVDYSIEMDRHGILLKGKCKQCGRDVARLIENDV